MGALKEKIFTYVSKSLYKMYEAAMATSNHIPFDEWLDNMVEHSAAYEKSLVERNDKLEAKVAELCAKNAADVERYNRMYLDALASPRLVNGFYLVPDEKGISLRYHPADEKSSLDYYVLRLVESGLHRIGGLHPGRLGKIPIEDGRVKIPYQEETKQMLLKLELENKELRRERDEHVNTIQGLRRREPLYNLSMQQAIFFAKEGAFIKRPKHTYGMKWDVARGVLTWPSPGEGDKPYTVDSFDIITNDWSVSWVKTY